MNPITLPDAFRKRLFAARFLWGVPLYAGLVALQLADKSRSPFSNVISSLFLLSLICVYGTSGYQKQKLKIEEALGQDPSIAIKLVQKESKMVLIGTCIVFLLGCWVSASLGRELPGVNFDLVYAALCVFGIVAKWVIYDRWLLDVLSQRVRVS